MAELQSVASALRLYVAKLVELGITKDIFVQLFEIPQARSELVGLLNALASQAPFSEASEYFVVSAAGGGRVDRTSLANHAASKVLRGQSPAEVVDNLSNFFVSRKTDVLEISCLHGVTVQRSIRLDQNTSIEPPEALKLDEQRAEVFGSGHFHPDRPQAAIVHRWCLDHALFPWPDEADRIKQIEFHGERGREHVQKTLAAIVVTGLAPELGVKFWQYVDPGYLSLDQTRIFSHRHPNLRFNSYEISESKVRSAFELIGNFKEWPKLQRLIARLCRARISLDVVDAHLDFGVIAESILTHGDQQHSEIVHRLSTRAAWFLGQDSEGRRTAAEMMKRLYTLRSAAAHTGTVPESGTKKWVQLDKQNADDLCSQLIAKTLHRGKFVEQGEWSSIVFG